MQYHSHVKLSPILLLSTDGFGFVFTTDLIQGSLLTADVAVAAGASEAYRSPAQSLYDCYRFSC